jgi:hypothetical protein
MAFRCDRYARRLAVLVGRNRGFESISLQRRVGRELAFPVLQPTLKRIEAHNGQVQGEAGQWRHNAALSGGGRRSLLEKCGYRSVIACSARGYFCSIVINLTMRAARPNSVSLATSRFFLA